MSPDFPVRVRESVATMKPYRQGRQAEASAVKLSSNENPFDPLPSVVSAVQAELEFNRYPDATADRLRQKLADKNGLPLEAVHVAAGSVAIISQLMQAVAGPGDEIIFAHPSFEGYSVLAATSGASTIVVDLDAQGRHDLERMAQAVTDETRLVTICSPNNPTGTTVSRIEFERFHAKVPSDVLILLDEAYAEFVTDPEAIDGLRDVSVLRHPNVVVLRTFSKAYGLAGLRIGYAVGHPRVLDAARATAIPLSVTGLAEVAALASLEAEMELRERIANLIQNRDGLQARLRNTGIAVPEAQGNFVWLPVGEAATELGEMFDQAGLVVRVFPSMGVRITVGDVNSVAAVADVVAAYQLAGRLVQ